MKERRQYGWVSKWQSPIVRALGVAAVVGAGVLTIIASGGGGGGECIDHYPNPDFDFMAHYGLDAADMDGDGLNDLVFSSALIYGSEPAAQECGGVARSDGSITVLLQDFSDPGRFLASQRYPVNSGNPNAVKLADLNGDALPDVIATNRWNSATFQTLLNDPLNVGQLGDVDAFATISEPHQIGVGDIDLDGRVDVAIAGGSTVAWHRQASDGSFNERDVIGAGKYAVALMDFDADGLLDVATCSDVVDDDVLIYRQSLNVPGSFSLAQSIRTEAAIWMLGAGDLNEDGRPDIAAVGFYTDDFRIHDVWYRVFQRSQAPLGFDVQLPRLEASNNLTAAPVIADLDGDQKEDVVIGGREGEVTVFLQDAAPGEFSRKQVYQLPPGEVVHTREVDAVAVADLDGDVLPDIAVSNGEVFILFQQQGAPGTFEQPVLVAGWEP